MGQNSALSDLTTLVGGLYTLPAVAVRVIELTGRPDVDVPELKRYIENDPALASKVLRVVNSSVFGLSSEVSDLGQALALLGIKPLKLLVLGFSLPDALFSNQADDVLNAYWQHAVTKAVTAREIGRRLWNTNSDEAFIAGMLEDIGELVLVQELAEPYISVMRECGLDRARLESVERSSLGFAHRELSAALLSTWRLPQVLVDASAAPRSISELVAIRSPQADLPQILHLAELVTQSLESDRREVVEELRAAGHAYRNLGPDQFSEMMQDLGGKIAHLAEALSIDLPEGMDIEKLIVEAHSRLAAAALEAIPDVDNYRRSGGSSAAAKPKMSATTETLSQALSRILEKNEAALGTGTGTSKEASKSAATSGNAEDEYNLNDLARSRASEEQLHVSPASELDLCAALLKEVSTLVSECRESRRPGSLMLFEFGHAKNGAAEANGDEHKLLLGLLSSICSHHGSFGARPLVVEGGQFAAILPDCERAAAVAAARVVVKQIRSANQSGTDGVDAPFSISAGVATISSPARNFRAQRCLNGALSSGGNCVKSIDIF